MDNKPTAQSLEAQAKLISEEIKPQLLACETFTRGLNRPPSNADSSFKQNPPRDSRKL